MRLGVLDVQGDVTEHLSSVKSAADKMGLDASVQAVNTADGISSLDALVIPGGESTTVSMLMKRFGLDEAIIEMSESIPLFGTCAGLVLLCKKGDNMKSGQSTLSLIDARMRRNAWGRQVDSFEAELKIPELGAKSFPGVFIRAPAIEEVWGGCKVLAEHEKRIVLARQGDILVSAFHPELTDDLRLHEYFLGMI